MCERPGQQSRTQFGIVFESPGGQNDASPGTHRAHATVLFGPHTRDPAVVGAEQFDHPASAHRNDSHGAAAVQQSGDQSCSQGHHIVRAALRDQFQWWLPTGEETVFEHFLVGEYRCEKRGRPDQFTDGAEIPEGHRANLEVARRMAARQLGERVGICCNHGEFDRGAFLEESHGLRCRLYECLDQIVFMPGCRGAAIGQGILGGIGAAGCTHSMIGRRPDLPTRDRRRAAPPRGRFQHRDLGPTVRGRECGGQAGCTRTDHYNIHVFHESSTSIC